MNVTSPDPSAAAAARPRRRLWPALLVVAALVALGLFGALFALWASVEHWHGVPFHVIVDGEEVFSGFEWSMLDSGQQLAVAGALLLGLIALAVVLPLALLAALALALTAVLAAVGLPLLAVAVVVAILLSPVVVLVWAVVRLLRPKPASPGGSGARA